MVFRNETRRFADIECRPHEGRAMNQDTSVHLRAEIFRRDVDRMIHWMENANVIRYLNEDSNIAHWLRQLNTNVPEPMLNYHFNQRGHFFMVCHNDQESVGFVRLMPMSVQKAYEIVYVIGEEALWGQGLGRRAVRCAQSHAFFQLRAERIVAKIMPHNHRSIRCVRACGFQQTEEGEKLHRFEMTASAYLQFLREATPQQ